MAMQEQIGHLGHHHHSAGYQRMHQGLRHGRDNYQDLRK
jgi:hypothetical protein